MDGLLGTLISVADQKPSYAVLAEGLLNPHDAKTAVSLIRYRPEQVAVIIDSTNAGRSVGDVLGLGDEIPIVATLEEAVLLSPNRLLVGTVASDGALPVAWRKLMLSALDQGLDLYSGMHTLLADDPEFRERARQRKRRIVDLRAVPPQFFSPRKSAPTLSISSSTKTGFRVPARLTPCTIRPGSAPT